MEVINIKYSNQYTNPLTEEEKKAIIELNKIGLNNIEIAKRINRNDTTIGRFLKKNGLHTSYNRLFTNNEIKQILELYKNGATGKEIMDQFDKVKCPETILRIVKQHGGKPRKCGIQVKWNTSYFHNIDTEQKAYFLGLWLADGNIHKQKRKTEQYIIQIALKNKDKYIIENFKQEIQSDNVISYYEKRDECHFAISSVEMAHDLMLHGVFPNKSTKEELTDTVSDELFHHYIRGIFDGDGTVFFERGNPRYLRFGFYGSHKIVEQIHQYLRAKIDISDNKVYDKETVSFSNYGKYNDVVNFYNLIYKDATVFLTRKKDKFDQYIESRKNAA